MFLNMSIPMTATKVQILKVIHNCQHLLKLVRVVVRFEAEYKMSMISFGPEVDGK